MGSVKTDQELKREERREEKERKEERGEERGERKKKRNHHLRGEEKIKYGKIWESTPF